MTYIIGHPIKHAADFYGRSQETARFFEIIGGTQAQSISVLGMRRAGKTSFLQHVAQKATQQQYLHAPANLTMIYLDISTCKSPAEFYYRLLQRLRHALGDIDTGFLWRQSPPEATNMYDVEAFLCQFPEQRIILLLDEFDHIRMDTFTPEFLTELRAMAVVMDYDLAYVTASHRDLFYLGSRVGLPPTSPFYNIFYPSPIHLAGLDTAVLADLIRTPAQREGVVFTDEDVRQITHCAGTLPFFVQATAAHMLACKKRSQTCNCDEIGWQLASDFSPYFEQWWRYFAPIDRDILRAVVCAKPVENLPYPAHLVQETWRILHLYGLLCEEDEGWQVNGRIFGNWIQQYAKLVEQKMEFMERHRDTTVAPPNLRQILTQSFNLDELRAFCFDLNVDFESLPGDGKFAKAQSLIEHFQNRRRLNVLVTAVRQERGAVI